MKVRFAVAPGGAAADHRGLAAFVDTLEDSGFDGMWLSDVTLAPVTDPLLGLALAAGRTERLRLGANVVPLGRNPYLLAKTLAQLDRLSGGRILLSFVTGIGGEAEKGVLGLAGSDAGTKTRTGAPGDRTASPRGAALEETLRLVRAWWAGERVTHRSSRWSFEELGPVVRPVQEPLEVWLGGRGPRALDRAGRVADGWLGAAVTPAEARPAVGRILESAQRAGRGVDPEHFGMSIACARDDPAPSVLQATRARRRDVDPRAIVPVGTKALRAIIEQYIEAGLSKFVLRPLDVAPPADIIPWLSDAVLALQT